MKSAVSILFATTLFAADPSPFTLEQVLSAPFPDGLTAGPGGRVAWILNMRGARNVWIAEPPDYRGRQVTKYVEDDGQEIAQLAWLPDGRGLLYVRGGDFENLQADPNPTSRAEGVDQSIWFVSTEGSIRKIAEGNTPKPTLQGDRIAYLKSRQIWTIGLNAGDKPSQLVHAKGNCSDLEWSPDGQALSFVSQRGDHSFVGVYRTATSVTYLDPSVDRDFDPVWSPDSKQIAFLRIPATGRAFRGGPQRSADQPWSIRVAEAQTGTGRQIWRAQPGPGSAFHAVTASHQIQWTTTKRLVFPWERDGWTHLYSVSPDGGDASLLTPGEFEVEHVTLSGAGGEITFSSNQDDIDRRHLWRVSAAPGSKPSSVTSGTGMEYAPVSLGAGGIAFLRSDARMPARAAILTPSGTRDLAPDSIPAEFPRDALVQPQQVIFPAADGMMIHGQLFLPRNAAEGRRPAIIFFHGGSRRQMLLGWHYMYYYSNAYAMNQYLASQGYVVLSVNYRSGIGYGLNFREALNYGLTGASEFNDVLGAGLYMRGRADVDPKRLGLWGGSYGGYLTALGLARASDLFAAGVDFHGVHDWSKLRSFEANSDAARTAFESSPMASVRTWRSPVLLIHGDDDRNVPFAETVRLVAALREQNVEFEELIFPDEIHDFLALSHWLRAYHAAVEFFGKKL